MLAGMDPETLAAALAVEIVKEIKDLGATIAALGVWFFGFIMWGQNRSRRKQADKDREAAQQQADRQAAAAAEELRAARDDAAGNRKVMEGLLQALTELLRRTDPAPRPDPTE